MKAHLSAELKRIEGGLVLTVVDHKRPVVTLSPVQEDALFVRKASKRYAYEPLAPLIERDPVTLLDQERGESW